MDLNIGRKLDDRYEITELIGIGGMAHVYKAVDLMEDKIVAVKILKNEYAESEEFLRRFRNESKAIAVLSHPNIVKIFDVGFSDEINFIVMEYIDGITLKEFMEQQHILRWKDALYFITQVLRALQHAHDRGIVHRDIKPQNIMLFADGTIKVMDFGIARFSRIDGKTISDKTIGSVHYISPEQARGDFTDERSDLYSVGIMLYEMVTGQKPFDGDNPVAVALMHMQDIPSYPRDVNPSVPEALEEIILHAIERNPSKRYQSASEMIKDMDMFKMDQTIVFGYKSAVYANGDDEATRYFNPVGSDIDDEDYDDDDYDEDDEDGEDDEEPKRSYTIPILAAVSVAVFIIAALIIANAFSKFGKGTDDGTRVSVPNFVNMSVSEVKETYGNTFQFQTSLEYSSEHDEGIVMKQGTAVGTSVKKGVTIVLTVSKGQRMLPVPDVTNMTYEDAASELEKYGFVATKITQPDDSVMVNYVIRTTPESNEEAAYGSTITVIVSSGALETNVKVPKLIGLTESEAISKLNELKLKYERYDVNTLEDKGKVIAQSEPEDKYVAKESVIKIGVSTGIEEKKSIDISIPIPAGISGKFEVVAYLNGSYVTSHMIDRGDMVAGQSIKLNVTNTGEKTYKILVKNVDTGKDIEYAQYTVNFETGKVTEDSISKDNFLSLVVTTTPTPKPDSSEKPKPDSSQDSENSKKPSPDSDSDSSINDSKSPSNDDSVAGT
ncbi:MAG: Stk1 family PASTA domain-containing Ser/Thr kinase [Clostridiales bacterium]|nr:Stk1 family PASTA domain-containing Ser/Thr kinase [Clostridiales bacterium]